MPLSIQVKLSHCVGCHNDVYNHGCEGSQRCWSLAKAKLIKRKEVHINQVPPWTQKPRLMLSCYHRPQYVYINGDRTC